MNKRLKSPGIEFRAFIFPILFLRLIPIVFQSELLRNLEITMVNADRKLESHWEFANQRLSLISNRYNNY